MIDSIYIYFYFNFVLFNSHYYFTSEYRDWSKSISNHKLVHKTPHLDFERVVPPELGKDFSYRSGLWPWQQASLNVLLAGLGLSIITAPILTGRVLSSLLFGVFLLLIFWRLALVLMGIALRSLCARDLPKARPEDAAPVYSILIPAYREAAVMPQIADALHQLEWPSDRLDIIVLLEADDPETIAAAHAANFPIGTRIYCVPTGGPRTKPNALNYGLARAREAFVTVYDAEDIPHPAQLAWAHARFQTVDESVVCLQAPLIADNARRGWLASQWDLEYAVQFGLLLPSLSLYQMPLLIGGTSNHFRKDALLALGGWDAWNVTEDADLGMRIARAGLRCSVIAAPTYEEAPTSLGAWTLQRSRWIKGFMQTWLVLMRTPRKTCQQMGGPAFAAMQASLGGAILAPLFHAPFILLIALTGFWDPLEIGRMGIVLLCAGLSIGLLSDLAAPGEWSWRRLFAVLTRPFYWPLLSFAAYRAIWELASNPFFWAKTTHHARNRDAHSLCSTGLSASASPPPS